jgi:hypothetical protein
MADERESIDLKDLDVNTRAIVLTLQDLIVEIHSFRADWLSAPMQEINHLMLANMKAQMGGGIVPAGGMLVKPGH